MIFSNYLELFNCTNGPITVRLRRDRIHFPSFEEITWVFCIRNVYLLSNVLDETDDYIGFVVRFYIIFIPCPHMEAYLACWCLLCPFKSYFVLPYTEDSNAFQITFALSPSKKVRLSAQWKVLRCASYLQLPIRTPVFIYLDRTKTASLTFSIGTCMQIKTLTAARMGASY